MKKLLICVVLVGFTTLALNATIKESPRTAINLSSEQINNSYAIYALADVFRDCFDYAIAQLDSFRHRYYEPDDELASFILNTAYANCWLDENPEFR